MTTPDLSAEATHHTLDAAVAEVLQDIAAAEIDRDYHAASAETINEQVEELLFLRQEAQRQASLREGDIAGSFIRGRAILWGAMDKPQGYATGTSNFANVLRMSPTADIPESILLRETRVVAALELSQRIEAGVPAVLSLYRDEGFTVYSAGLPDHDGFSFSAATDDPQRQFMIGIGGQTNIRLTDAWHVYPGVGDAEVIEDIAIEPAVEVYTGEEVAPFLTAECERYVSESQEADAALAADERLPRTDQTVRDMYDQRWRKQLAAEGIVATIHALRQVGMQFDHEPDRQQLVVDLLCDHLFVICDEYGHPEEEIMAIAEAMQYIYPPASEIPLAYYLIDRSYQLSEATLYRHRIAPVREVLIRLCRMDEMDANRRLHGG